jgi:hypothetical protein
MLKMLNAVLNAKFRVFPVVWSVITSGGFSANIVGPLFDCDGKFILVDG